MGTNNKYHNLLTISTVLKVIACVLYFNAIASFVGIVFIPTNNTTLILILSFIASMTFGLIIHAFADILILSIDVADDVSRFTNHLNN